jgi:hypothetical protein
MESNNQKKSKPYLKYILSFLAGIIIYQLIKYLF